MGENCGDCMEWEEEIYWTHFKFIHFSQFLLPGFDQHLAVPQKFSTHYIKKLPKTVTLKSPSGITYNVGLQAENGTLVFRRGWEEFVRDHLLEKNDLLVFKFDGSSHFDVLIFDGKSFCEKASSYFVKKCGHTEGANGANRKRKASDSSDNSSRSDEDRAPKKCINTDFNTAPVPVEQPVLSPIRDEHKQNNNLDDQAAPNQPPVISPTGNEREQHVDFVMEAVPLKQHVTSSTGIGRVRVGKYALSTLREMQNNGSNMKNSCDRDAKLDIKKISVGTKERSSSSKFSTGKRAMFETEKRNALSLARVATSKDGFLVIMKRSHVLTKYFLTIPYKWLQKFVFVERMVPVPEVQDVVLRVDQATWNTTFKYFRNGGFGGLKAGWRKFVQDNGLYESDVCVFEPANTESRPLLLDVHIFRAVGLCAPTSADPIAIE